MSHRIGYQPALWILSCIAASSALAAPPIGSAYYTDTQRSFVEDATSESIGQVNMITCFMSAMRPDALVNQNAYIALVDQNKCDQNKRSSSSNSGAGDGASQAADYMTATVKSTRASNSDPMIAKIWVNDEQDGTPATIYVNLSATQAPSPANPYGAFRLDFCGRPVGGGGSCMMNGYLQGGDGTLSYFQREARPGQSHTTALKLSSVGTSSGGGRLDSLQTENNVSNETTFDFSYNSSLFLRGDQCFSRDATDPQTGQSVWRYGLYDASSGDRIALNSGFPIEYTQGGATYQGFLGYWGLSLPAAATATLVTGSTVQKVDYGSGNTPTRTSYTVVNAPGKLMSYTRQTSTLRDLDQIRITTWIGDASNFYAGAGSNTQYEMYWDQASGNFKVTGEMNCSQSGCQIHSLDVAQDVSPAFWAGAGLQGWSNSFGGELFVDLVGAGDVVTSASVAVAYRRQDVVYPSDMPATLYCLNSCPTAASLGGYFADGSSAASPYTAASYNNWNPTPLAAVVSYTSDVAAAVLRDDTATTVAYANAAGYAQRPQYQNGVRSGRMFANLAAAECSAGSGTYCDYKVNSASVYYIWETGPNNWNQFTVVKDAGGNFVHFDAPLQVVLDVPTGVQYGEYAGKSLVLQYGGFGDLWGIPGSCVSHLTNLPVSCDTADSRYVPMFVVPFDVSTGVVHSGQTNYLVKWLEREIRFARKPLNACTGAGLVAPTGIVLPTAADLKDPGDANSDVYIGVKPVVTDAPRVIHGEVKF
jgi:hypothetical protein